MSRTITVRLTKPQMAALQAALVRATDEWEAEMEDGDTCNNDRRRCADRALIKLLDAWYDR